MIKLRIASLALICAMIAAVVWMSMPLAIAQGTASADAQELTRLLHAFLAGAGRNDAAMHDRFWADDLIYTSALGVRRGKAEIMSGLRSAPRDAASSNAQPAPTQSGPATIYSAEEIRIQQYGDTAIVAFRLVATPRAQKPQTSPGSSAADNPAAKASPPAKADSQASAAVVASYLNTGTFLKRNGEWRAVAWQATRIP